MPFWQNFASNSGICEKNLSDTSGIMPSATLTAGGHKFDEDSTKKIAAFKKELGEAMNAFSAGGYRRGFEILYAVEAQVRSAQQDIVTLELSITAPNPQ